MTEKAVLHASVDVATRDEAAAVLAGMGMTVSDAIELMLARIAREKVLPFEPFVPNEATIAAMKAARERTDMRRAGTFSELMVRLNAEGH